jgi:hypothetical protein
MATTLANHGHSCVDNPSQPCDACNVRLAPLMPKDVLSAAWKFEKEFDTDAAWESGKLTFATVGAAGYAALLATAHYPMAAISLAVLGCLWYGIYRMIR